MSRHNLTTTESPKRGQVLTLVREKGVLRPKDLEALGIAPEYLNKLHSEGVLDRPARGIYRLARSKPKRFSQLAEISRRAPRSVITLLSALDFHGLTTQFPHEIWMAIPEKARAPRIEYPPTRVVRYGEAAYRFGIEVHMIDNVEVRVYSAAKTVADCFKFRGQIGLDVAIEALRESLQQKKATNDAIWNAAKACRMTNVIRPYLEAVQ